jgi:cAMP phosphodiesterase
MTKCRSLHKKRNFAKAIRFLRAARKTTNDYNRKQRINTLWIKHANLKPVIEYLSQAHR